MLAEKYFADDPNTCLLKLRQLAEPLAQLVSVDPYYEEGHSLLIEANEAVGRQDAAAAPRSSR